MLESDVRRWLKAEAKSAGFVLSWVEQAAGGSVGVPDVFLGISERWLPVELKAAALIGGRLKAKVRPSQLQFHSVAFRNDLPTAFLLGFLDHDRKPRYCLVEGCEALQLHVGLLKLEDCRIADKGWLTQSLAIFAGA